MAYGVLFTHACMHACQLTATGHLTATGVHHPPPAPPSIMAYNRRNTRGSSVATWATIKCRSLGNYRTHSVVL